jgi:hypothetical protein
MITYRPAGQEFQIPCPVLELDPFRTDDKSVSAAFSAVPASLTMLSQTVGLVGGGMRSVETWSAPPGLIVKTAGGSDFYIAPDGSSIQRIGTDDRWPRLDRDILVGPVLVLALALRGVWSLHASAVTCNGRALLFLGESGQGKSTLAGFLASGGDPESRLVSDDILPVTLDEISMNAWPHFPQLKLPLDSQPGVRLPERLPVGWLCLLDESETPFLQRLGTAAAMQLLLRHTAGTRLFPPELLSRHLAFCAQAAARTPIFRLAFPRRMDILPDVEALLETLC